jgi:hypothetical protein
MWWIGIHEIGMIPSWDIVHEFWFDPLILIDVVDPHVRTHIEDSPTTGASDTVRVAASWIRKDWGGVTRSCSWFLTIGLLFLPLVSFQVNDENIIEDLSLESDTTDSTEDHDTIANSGCGVVRTWVWGTDFGFGVFGLTTGFLVGWLLPGPSVSDFEEITVIEPF